MQRLRRLQIVVGAVIFYGVCAGAAWSVYATAGGSPPKLVVTRKNKSLPRGCAPGDMGRLILRFFEAVNSGDEETLASVFAGEQEFQWYSVTEGSLVAGRHTAITERGSVLPYFRQRRSVRERMSLRMVDVGRGAREGVGIGFVVIREADDLAHGWGGTARIATGKAGITCPGQKVVAWSMAMRAAPMGDRFPPSLKWTCPKPKGWRALQGPAVACARSSR